LWLGWYEKCTSIILRKNLEHPGFGYSPRQRTATRCTDRGRRCACQERRRRVRTQGRPLPHARPRPRARRSVSRAAEVLSDGLDRTLVCGHARPTSGRVRRSRNCALHHAEALMCSTLPARPCTSHASFCLFLSHARPRAAGAAHHTSSARTHVHWMRGELLVILLCPAYGARCCADWVCTALGMHTLYGTTAAQRRLEHAGRCKPLDACSGCESAVNT